VAPPSLVMVAGPNGSGKTTLIRTLRAASEVKLPALYINADDLARERGLDARAAQKLAGSLRSDAIARRESFLYETVMSHPSKIAELQAAAVGGYAITVVFVATDDPDINIERVRLRVADGGHPVPRDRIRARHWRSIALAPSAIAFATQGYVYDNTTWGSEAAQQLQAVLVATRLQPLLVPPAAWVRELIQRTNARAAELDDLYQAAKDHMPLAVPNLAASVFEGVMAIAGQYFTLQLSRNPTATVLHDMALLTKPVVQRRSYRIEYDDGVATVSRPSAARIRAVKSSHK
jgi:predicted ABC-type ATPase